MMIRSSRLTIFEGPDGGGKTTAARDFARVTGARYVHFANLPHATTGLARMYVEAMLPALLGYQDVVFDRCWMSEVPYGLAFRGGQDRLGTATVRMLERLAMRCGAVVVQCQPSLETCLRNFNRRRHEEMLKSDDQLVAVYDSYVTLGTALPRLRYDFTTDGPLPVLNHLRMPEHDLLVSSAGNLDATVALVGERFAAHKNDDSYYQWPFASFNSNGCSQWLAETLEDGGIPEESLFWVNADQLNHVELGGFDTVVALGAAAGILLERKGARHVQVDHPQAHKRFSHTEPYPLIHVLQEALW